MPQRPLWLLDIDGVVNVNPGKPGWSAAPRRTVIHVGAGRSYLLRWAPALIARIRTLHATEAVEIRWATSWIGHTDKLAATLALPDFAPAYPAPRTPYSEVHVPLKQAAAGAALSSGRRLIWTDDEAIPADWFGLENLAGSALLIAPRPNRGLQPEHLDAIEAFAGVGASA